MTACDSDTSAHLQKPSKEATSSSSSSESPSIEANQNSGKFHHKSATNAFLTQDTTKTSTRKKNQTKTKETRRKFNAYHALRVQSTKEEKQPEDEGKAIIGDQNPAAGKKNRINRHKTHRADREASAMSAKR